MIQQETITLKPRGRGFHLITEDILTVFPKLPEKGLLHLFMQHTSAGLAINENADPTVRTDFESIFNHLVPENQSYYQHTLEGPDDMPAHAKSVLCGHEMTIPITNHQLNIGIWQGIYYCEFRNQRHYRKVVVTVYS